MTYFDRNMTHNKSTFKTFQGCFRDLFQSEVFHVPPDVDVINLVCSQQREQMINFNVSPKRLDSSGGWVELRMFEAA